MCPVEEVPSFSFVDVDADAAMFRSPAQDQSLSDSVQGSDQASPSKSSLSSAQESKDVNLCKCYKTAVLEDAMVDGYRQKHSNGAF